MKRLVCNGCGLAEDLDHPSGKIHRVQLLDLTPRPEAIGAPSKADSPIEEDLCDSCRKKLRMEYFGDTDAELLEMPLMKGA